MRRIPREKGKGFAGSILFHTGLLVLLFLLTLSVPLPDTTESGLLVNFGFDDTGSGLIEPSAPPSTPEPAVPVQAAETNSREEAIMTQDFDKEVPEVKKVDPEAEKKRIEQIEAEKKKRAELEAERLKRVREEEEKRKAEEEMRKEVEAKSRINNAFANAKNAGTNAKSEGVAGGQGNQGVPEGSPDSNNRGAGIGTGNNGVSYSLEGRIPELLPPAKYDIQSEGIVVVEVSVDRAGRVTQANPGVKGSTTLDENLLKIAKEAALKAKFEPKPDAPVSQRGTITYNFKLK